MPLHPIFQTIVDSWAPSPEFRNTTQSCYTCDREFDTDTDTHSIEPVQFGESLTMTMVYFCADCMTK